MWKLLLAAVLTTTLWGCGKDRVVLFHIPIELNFTIDAGLNPFQVHYYIIRSVQTNLESLKQQFNSEGDMDLVIRPESAVLSAAFSDATFEFIDEIGISVFQGEDHEQDRDAFLTDQVPPNAGKNVFISPFDTDLSDVINRESVNFKIRLRLRASTPAFIDSRIRVNFTAE